MRFGWTPALSAATILLAGTLHAQGVASGPAPRPTTGGSNVRIDTPQVRVFVATLQPHAPARATAGHATHRVLIYLDEGQMTRQEGGGETQTLRFSRGDVRWRAASGPYIAENVGNRPIRILEVDLKGPPSGQDATTPLDPTLVDAQHYSVLLENDYVRVLRVRYGPRETGARHEHKLNRVVVYLNDQPNGKADDARIAGPATHVEQNASDAAAERIAVEIK
ncbi:MAG: hypothetical protein AB7N65_31695 [Vicinamibacterales bacterium]